MKEAVIRIIPPEVYQDDFEDLLATESLFVDYFNAFLQLPTFPEPLCFNKESGGFEIITDAKKELANEIKAAIRAGRRRKKIYRPVHQHSFSTIPLIPIDEPSDVTEKEIDTSFSVRTLNKEQGIQWVKRERLPLFLESDFYLEYRLAKLVSQVKTGSDRESVSIRLDYTPRIRQIEEEEVEEEPPEDEGEVLMRNMFVCMGDTTTTDTEAWVSQAKLAMQTTTSSAASLRPKSAVGHTRPASSRPISGRPISARSNPSSVATRRLDSGFWSPNKLSSVQGSTVDMATYTMSLLSTDDNDDIPLGGDLFHPGPKPSPMTPRPSDDVCAVAPSSGKTRVYAALPHHKSHRTVSPPPPIESEQEDQGIGDDSSVSTELSGTKDGDIQDKKSSTSENIDQLGDAIVGAVLKSALSVVTGQSEDEIAHNPQFSYLFKDIEDEKCKDGGTEGALLSSKKDERKTEMKMDEDVEGSVGGSTSHTIIGDTKDSDSDSVLNSDNDYEEERDDFFRKHKHKYPDAGDKDQEGRSGKAMDGGIGDVTPTGKQSHRDHEGDELIEAKRQRTDSENSVKEDAHDRKDTIWRAHEEDSCSDVHDTSINITESRCHESPSHRESHTPESVHSRVSDHDRSAEFNNELPTKHINDNNTAISDSKKSANVELLCRLFPHMKRSVLQLILQGCNEDTTQAIEQVLNNHSHKSQLQLAATTGKPQPSPQPFLHNAYFSAAAATTTPSGPNGLKSAFSPISSITSPAAALNALRYPYPPTTRGLPIGFPYPPNIFPGLASLGYNYNAMAAAVSGGQKPPGVFAYNPYANPYATSSDK